MCRNEWYLYYSRNVLSGSEGRISTGLSRTGLLVLGSELISLVLTVALGYMAISDGAITLQTYLVVLGVILLFGLTFERRYIDWT